MTSNKPGRSRRKARELALRALYMVEQQRGNEKKPAQKEDETIELFFEQRPSRPEVREYAGLLVKGVLANLGEIDGHIEEASINWKLERIAHVDRNILRIGTYEILLEPDVPPQVSIDEAIDIARKYGGEDSPSFVNGILDKILKKAEG